MCLSPTKIAENLQGPCPIFGPACEPCNASSMSFLLDWATKKKNIWLFVIVDAR